MSLQSRPRPCKLELVLKGTLKISDGPPKNHPKVTIFAKDFMHWCPFNVRIHPSVLIALPCWAIWNNWGRRSAQENRIYVKILGFLWLSAGLSARPI